MTSVSLLDEVALIDGTFRVVPFGFKQLIVIHCFHPQTQQFIPSWYILCSCKKEEMYKRIFFDIDFILGKEWKPKVFVSDFEYSLLNAIRTCFPSTIHIGCYFHFKQANQKNMVKLQINAATQTKLHVVLQKLTLLGEEQIIETLGLLKTKYTKLSPYWNYFERVWIKKFPPKLWTLIELKKIGYDALVRTTNRAERYNRRINESLPSHTSFWNLSNFLKQEARSYFTLFSAVLLHTPPVCVSKLTMVAEG